MTINIKAIRAAAKENQKRDNTILLRPSTVIALCDEIERLQKDAARYRWIVEYFVSDRTDLDDALVDASDLGVEQVTAVIDDAMESKT